jgi:hypothetical protein
MSPLPPPPEERQREVEGFAVDLVRRMRCGNVLEILTDNVRNQLQIILGIPAERDVFGRRFLTEARAQFPRHYHSYFEQVWNRLRELLVGRDEEQSGRGTSTVSIWRAPVRVIKPEQDLEDLLRRHPEETFYGQRIRHLLRLRGWKGPDPGAAATPTTTPSTQGVAMGVQQVQGEQATKDVPETAKKDENRAKKTAPKADAKAGKAA